MGTGWICKHLCTSQKGIANVSLRVSLWDCRDLGKQKELFRNQRDKVLSSKAYVSRCSVLRFVAQTNELIAVQDIARYRFW